MQWVVSLDYEVETQRVAAASEDAVAIIDAQVNWSTIPIAIPVTITADLTGCTDAQGDCILLKWTSSGNYWVC